MVNNYTGEWTYEPGTPRSLFYAMGYTDEELERPLVGVCCAKNEIIPGHAELDRIAEAVLRITDKFKTTLENVCYMVLADYESELEYEGRADDQGYIRGLDRYSADDLDAFLYDMNGISEYDYYC